MKNFNKKPEIKDQYFECLAPIMVKALNGGVIMKFVTISHLLLSGVDDDDEIKWDVQNKINLKIKKINNIEESDTGLSEMFRVNAKNFDYYLN